CQRRRGRAPAGGARASGPSASPPPPPSAPGPSRASPRREDRARTCPCTPFPRGTTRARPRKEGVRALGLEARNVDRFLARPVVAHDETPRDLPDGFRPCVRGKVDTFRPRGISVGGDDDR